MKELKITEVKRVSFQKDMIQRGMQGRIESEKLGDGTFKAKMANQNIEATGATEIEAIQNVKKVFQDQLTKGDFSGIQQKML